MADNEQTQDDELEGELEKGSPRMARIGLVIEIMKLMAGDAPSTSAKISNTTTATHCSI
jgi:hypothetical protein